MNTCPGCHERVAAGEEECSHCGTPLLSASAPGSSPVIAGRETYIAGAGGGSSAGGGFPAAPTARKTRIEGEAVPPPNKAADEELIGNICISIGISTSPLHLHLQLSPLVGGIR